MSLNNISKLRTGDRLVSITGSHAFSFGTHFKVWAQTLLILEPPKYLEKNTRYMFLECSLGVRGEVGFVS